MATYESKIKELEIENTYLNNEYEISFINRLNSNILDSVDIMNYRKCLVDKIYENDCEINNNKSFIDKQNNICSLLCNCYHFVNKSKY